MSTILDFLQRENSLALPSQKRHLISLILRKLLASSPQAILATLQKMRQRLQAIQAKEQEQAISLPELFDEEEISSNYEEWQENNAECRESSINKISGIM